MVLAWTMGLGITLALCSSGCRRQIPLQDSLKAENEMQYSGCMQPHPGKFEEKRPEPNACKSIQGLEGFVACVNLVKESRTKPNVSDVLAQLTRFGKSLTCTKSDLSAQPGSPTNPRCFLKLQEQDGIAVMPSWTLEGNGDRFEVGEFVDDISIPATIGVQVSDRVDLKTGEVLVKTNSERSSDIGLDSGDKGIVLADVEMTDGKPTHVIEAMQRAYCGTPQSDPCAHCHVPFVQTQTGGVALGPQEFFPDEQGWPTIYDGANFMRIPDSLLDRQIQAKRYRNFPKPLGNVLRPIHPRKGQRSADNIHALVIPESSLRTFLSGLFETCATTPETERCRRLEVMLEMVVD